MAKSKRNTDLGPEDNGELSSNPSTRQHTVNADHEHGDKNLPAAESNKMKSLHYQRQFMGKFHVEDSLQTLQDMPIKAYQTGKDAVFVVTRPVYKTTKSFTESFKTFVESRSVVEVAVAFVMGLSFREICTALVSDVFGPIVGLVLPYDDHTLSERFFVIRNGVNNTLAAENYSTRAQAKAAGAITINYGHLMKVVVDFLLLCFVLYLFINYFYLKLITKPTITNPCPFCKEDTKEGAVRCPHCTQVIVELNFGAPNDAISEA